MNKHDIAQNLNLEKKVLIELRKNCRLNLDDIGKKCGCSRYKVRKVMKKLEDNKTILGYTTIIDPKKLNLKHYIVLIKKTKIPVAAETLKKLPVNDITDLLPNTEININLEDTSYLHGNYDWFTSFTTDDISNAKEFCNQILKIFHKHVANIELLETVMPIRTNGLRISHPDQIPEIL